MGEIRDVQEPIFLHAELTGWLGYRMRFLGRRGCPDGFFFRRGRVVIMEFKDRNGRLSLWQKRVRKALEDHGMEVHVPGTAAEGIQILDYWRRRDG